MRDIWIRRRYFLCGLLAAALFFMLDRVCKQWLIFGMDLGHRPALVVTPFFSLVLWWNKGVSFGMFSHQNARVALLCLEGVISIMLLIWLWRSTRWRLAMGLGMVIGGALGNAWDRHWYGAVADFFYFHLGPYYFPAFNPADSWIFLGVVLLFWDSIVEPSKKG